MKLIEQIINKLPTYYLKKIYDYCLDLDTVPAQLYWRQLVGKCDCTTHNWQIFSHGANPPSK